MAVTSDLGTVSAYSANALLEFTDGMAEVLNFLTEPLNLTGQCTRWR